MAKLQLSLAIGDYDRTRPLLDGSVQIDGVNPVTMTLTSPMCPSAQQLPADVQARVRAVPGVHDVHVEIVREPPWTAELMSDVARLQLGF